MKKHLFFIFALIGLQINVMAADVIWTNRFEGPQIYNRTSTIQDGDFAQLNSGAFTDLNPFSYLRLGIDERENMAFVSAQTTILVNVSITPYTDAGVAQTSFTASLQVRYAGDNPGEGIDVEDFRMEGVHKFKAKVTQVYYNGVLLSNGSAIHKMFYLEWGYQAERYYKLNTTQPPLVTRQFIKYNTDGTIDNTFCSGSTFMCGGTEEILFNWSYVDGAEEYELEWTWIDAFSDASLAGYTFATEIALSEFDFQHNSTRIRTKEHSYRIPRIYAKGFLIYRVRAVGRWMDAYVNKELFGAYSSGTNAKNKVSDWPFIFMYVTDHEDKKNWQYQSTYAEDGKKKEVVQYFDGSLRGRQTVTRINSHNQSVVAETVYDNEGRGVVQILPVPQDNPALKYYTGLNKSDISGGVLPYSHKNFDWETTVDPNVCETQLAEKLHGSSGSGNYYSTAGHTSDTDWQQFVPDAKGYGFTIVEYTPDNTGRMRKQSGVGIDHTLGSGHETMYYYTQPAQEELNRLFGHKVGYKQRYKKNMVVDANGQVSISYLDPQGRVVATTLAGADPAGPLEDIGSNTNTPEADITTDLLNKVNDSDPNTADDDNILFSTSRFGALNDGLKVGTQLAVTDQKLYDFNYAAHPGAFTISCDTDGDGVDDFSKSFPYEYDIKLSLTNDCGTNLFQTNPLSQTQFGNQISWAWQFEDANLERGSYTLYKELKVDEEKFIQFKAEFLDGAQNLCLFDDFVPIVTPCDDVETSCEDCYRSLGSQTEYVSERTSEYVGFTDLSPAERQAKTLAWEAEFNTKRADCGKLCRLTMPCEGYERAMMKDVSPGGQYGALSSSDPVSVYNTNSTSTLSGNWKTPGIAYQDENGLPATVTVHFDGTIYSPAISGVNPASGNGNAAGDYEVAPNFLVNLSDFESRFQPSWAKALIPYHPEYPLYLFALELCNRQFSMSGFSNTDDPNTPDPDDEITTASTVQLSSYEYDAVLAQYTNNYLEADAGNRFNDGVANGSMYSLDFISTADYTANGSSTINTRILALDPYFNLTYPSNFISNNNHTLKMNLITSALQQYKRKEDLSGYYTMFEFAVKTAIFGNDYNVPNLSAYSSWSAIATNAPDKLDQVWSSYKSYYLAAKGEINQYLMDLYGARLNPPYFNGLFNGCIGSGNLSSGVLPSMIQKYPNYAMNLIIQWQQSWWNNSPNWFFNFNWPLYFCTGMFENKEIRIIRHDNLYSSDLSEAENIAELQAQADYEVYMKTGLCPDMLDLEHVLSNLALSNRLKTTNVSHVTIPEFTPNLLGAMLQSSLGGASPGLGTNMIVDGTTVGTSLQLDFRGSANGGVTSLRSRLTFPQMGSLAWSNYGNTWFIYELSNLYLVDNYNFELLIKAGPTLQTAIEYVVTVNQSSNSVSPYEMVVLGNNCLDEIKDPDCKKEANFERDLETLMQALAMSGNLYNNNYNITNLPEYVNSSLPEYLGTTNVIWSTTYNSFSIISDQNTFVLGFNGSVANIAMLGAINVSTNGTVTMNVFRPTNQANEGENAILTGSYSYNCGSTSTSGSGGASGPAGDPRIGSGSSGSGSPAPIPPPHTPPCELDFSCHCGSNNTVNGLQNALQNFLNEMIDYTGTIDPNVGIVPSSLTALAPYLSIEDPRVYEFRNSNNTIFVSFGDCSFRIPYGNAQPIANPNGSSALPPSNTPTAVDVTGLTATNGFGGSFTAQIQMSNNTSRIVSFTISCLKQEEECCQPENVQAVRPISCNDAYSHYKELDIRLGRDMGISLEQFCESSYAYITDAYLYYIDQLNINSYTDPNYLTIFQFGNTPLGYSNEELIAAVDAYIVWSATADFAAFPDRRWDYFIKEVYYPQHPVLCPLDYPVNFPEIIDETPCNQWEDQVSAVNMQNQQAIYLEQMANAFTEGYINGAMNTIVETFNETHLDKEFHYTLYYYDRAGNLIQTVPPKGVNRLNITTATQDLDINMQRQTDPYPYATADDNYKAPVHTLETVYRYNSLNQLVYQNTPDGGESKFAYDNLGRLFLSQNAKQKMNPNGTGTAPQFSYTLYDGLGRVTEVGELTRAGIDISDKGRVIFAGTNIEVTLVGNQLPASYYSVREEVTRSIYDELPAAMSATVNNTSVLVRNLFGTSYAAYNTRNRIVGVIYQQNYNSNITVYNYGSFYDYDVHGNVKQLLQVNHDTELTSTDQTVKLLQYEFDLVSGNVKEVTYQKGKKDQFKHRYTYDDDNRITIAETSDDGVHYEKDAKYFYYDHGPLARTELGERKVQALDYAYTIQGWIKTVNGEKTDPMRMMGQDGLAGTTNGQVARDAFGYSLSYFENDYQAANTNMLSYSATNPNTPSNTSLFNGNIRAMFTTLSQVSFAPADPNFFETHQTVYTYDQLNRLKSMKGYKNDGQQSSNYSSRYDYDANGNIKTAQRYIPLGGSPVLMDDFHYAYEGGGLNSNRLIQVKDLQTQNNVSLDDINAGQISNNYKYDLIGQLTGDDQEGIKEIKWKVTNKVEEVTYYSGKRIEFKYDPMGHRIAKKVWQTSGATPEITYYILDAKGNPISTYKRLYESSGGGSGYNLYLSERNLYGTSRMGIENLRLKMNETYTYPSGRYTMNNTTGDKYYELGNHLGNVLNVITDRKIPVDNAGTVGYYTAEIISFSDYEPFGMQLPGRYANTPKYRYGFNGMEADNEVKGQGNSYTTEFRQYDPRVGRWLSLDPMMQQFPHQSPYVAFDNNPIYFNDPKGQAANGPGKPTKYQKAIVEGVKTLTDNGLVFGGPADEERKFNNQFFMISPDNQLKVLPGKLASEAIADIFAHSDKYAIDCAEFIQVLHLNAKLEVMGAKKFDKMYKDSPLLIKSQGTLGVSSSKHYTKDVNEEHWHSDDGTPLKTTVGKLLQDIPIGTRLAITNIDTKADDSFHNENFIYTGKDASGQMMFAAHPYGPNLSITDIMTKSAMHSSTENKLDLDADAFDAYMKANVGITEIEVYNEK